MAKVEHIIPFIVKWEAGVIMRKGESFERLFDRAKKRGVSNDPADLGGLTVVGVTYATYKQYCKRKGYLTPTTHRFLNLNYTHIKSLGKQLKKLGMLIVQDQIWNRVTINRARKKATRYYMDEFHLLLREEQTAAYSVEIWKRFRKWSGIPTGITQNVKDLLSSREVENIFENSDFVLMLNQAVSDRTILAKQLNISPQQMKYVTHTEAGEGLLFYGNVILPFVDHFPKDTKLYKVMTTKPEEVSGE